MSSYDGRGNLISSGTSSYSYTSENYLKTGPDGLTLDYDPLGRLYETKKGNTVTRFGYACPEHVEGVISI